VPVDELTPAADAPASEAPTYAEVTAAYRPLTDQGNGERLAKRENNKLLYTAGTGWLVWDGKRWHRAELEEEREQAKRMARSINTEVAELAQGAQSHPNEMTGQQLNELAQATAKWAHKTESTPRIDAALKSARSERRLRVRITELDAQPDLLNVQNGTLNLRTLQLAKHDPTQRLTKIADAAFDPDATAPFWDSFLRRILPDDAVRSYVQTAAGYSMLGSYSEYLFVPYGQGANGKSTFLWGLRHVLGDYAHEAPSDLLVRRRERTAGNDSAMAALRGRRLVTTVETEQGSRLAEVQVKQLTGERDITAKLMRQDHFTFENQAAVWLATNHRPFVQGLDEAMWRRLRLIPFDQFIPEDQRLEPDEVQRRLRDEAAGILNWALRGVRRHREVGVRHAPPAVLVATNDYKKDMDPLQTWLEEWCEVEPDRAAPYRDLRRTYTDHCAIAGRQPLSEANFQAALRQHGFKADRKSIDGSQQRVWHGLQLVGRPIG
jgi:putative DNA primase/helicase